MGYRFFLLCLKQLFHNWKVALQLSWFWILLLTASSFLITSTLHHQDNSGSPTLYFLTSIVVVPFYFVSIISIAVGWHRFVLRNEHPPKIHLINFKWPIGSYISACIRVFLLVLLIFIPITLFIMPMLLSTVSTEDLIGDYRPITLFLLLFISYLVTVLYVWITLRVGLVLPASAIGNRLKLHEAFNFTRPVGGDLIVTAALIAGVYHIPDIFEFVSPSEPTQSENQAVIAFLSDLIFNWISLFLGFGILTILYGHLCEEKSI